MDEEEGDARVSGQRERGGTRAWAIRGSASPGAAPAEGVDLGEGSSTGSYAEEMARAEMAVFSAPGGLTDKLVRAATQALPELPLEHLGLLCWGAVMAGPPGAKDLVVGACHRLYPHLGQAHARDISLVLWCCAELGYYHQPTWEWLAGPQGQQLLQAAPAKELVNVCVAAARLQVQDTGFLQAAVGRVLRQARSGRMVWSGQGVGSSSNSRYSAVILVTMCWALVMLGYRCVPLLEVTVAVCSGLGGPTPLGQLPPSSLCQLLWALAASGAYNRQLFHMLCSRLRAHVRTLSAAQQVDVLWSLAVARHLDEDLVMAVAANLATGPAVAVEQAAEGAGGVLGGPPGPASAVSRAGELSQLMWAMAYLTAGVCMQVRGVCSDAHQ